MTSLVKIPHHLATFGTLLVVFMHNLIVFDMALFAWEFYVATAIFFYLLHPHIGCIYPVDFRVRVAFNMQVELPLVCENSSTMLTCPWITVIVDLFHVIIHLGLWIAFSTILTWNPF